MDRTRPPAFPEFTPPVNASINITEPTGSVPTRWSPASFAGAWPGPAPGTKKSGAHFQSGQRESHHHLARTRRHHDRTRHGDTHQQKLGDGRRANSRFAGALSENQFERPHQV